MYSIILSLNMRHNQDRSSRAKCVYAESGIVVPERYQPAEIDTSGALHGFDPAAKLLDEYELVHRDLLAVCAGGFVVRRVAAAWPHVSCKAIGTGVQMSKSSQRVLKGRLNSRVTSLSPATVLGKQAMQAKWFVLVDATPPLHASSAGIRLLRHGPARPCVAPWHQALLQTRQK